MEPTNFAHANATFGPPPGVDESQCARIIAWQGEAQGGTLDGLGVVVTAWKPDEQDLARINAGEPVYVSYMGCGLVAHFVTTEFRTASLNCNG